jgi:hypothetical protein
VCGGRVQLQWGVDVRQLQRWLCVSSAIDDTDTCRDQVPRWHVQPERRRVVHQLQRRVRVSEWLNHCDAGDGHVPCRQVLAVGSDVVQQVQRRLRVPRRFDVADAACRHLPGRDVQHRRRAVVHQLQRARWLGLRRWIDDNDGLGVCRWSVRQRWLGSVRQLQRRVCMPSRIDVVDAAVSDLSGGHLQRVRRHGVQQLHHVSRLWLWQRVGDTLWHDLRGWAVQRWRHGTDVQQLQCRLRVPSRVHECSTLNRAVSRWHLRRVWCGSMHQLQRWIYVPSRLDVVNSRFRDMCCGHLQPIWLHIVQQLQCWLCVPSRVNERSARRSVVSCGSMERIWCDVV